MNRFFSKSEEDIIIRSIQEAERLTESEIRVHVDFADPHVTVMDAAIKAFYKLRMNRTQHHNAVLIFLLPDRAEFAVIGDEAIHRKVGPSFWENINQLMKSYFVDARFVLGTCEGIERIGKEMKIHFPTDKENNELPDEISYT